jgi:hypothetical protein
MGSDSLLHMVQLAMCSAVLLFHCSSCCSAYAVIILDTRWLCLLLSGTPETAQFEVNVAHVTTAVTTNIGGFMSLMHGTECFSAGCIWFGHKTTLRVRIGRDSATNVSNKKTQATSVTWCLGAW